MLSKFRNKETFFSNYPRLEVIAERWEMDGRLADALPSVADLVAHSPVGVHPLRYANSQSTTRYPSSYRLHTSSTPTQILYPQFSR